LFLLVKLQTVQGLTGKWRAELAGYDAAERCASDLEAALAQSSESFFVTVSKIEYSTP
jgi:hypothetical protein